jgi:hypothetical protein
MEVHRRSRLPREHLTALCIVLIIYSCSDGDRTQGLMHARQAVYHPASLPALHSLKNKNILGGGRERKERERLKENNMTSLLAAEAQGAATPLAPPGRGGGTLITTHSGGPQRVSVLTLLPELPGATSVEAAT